MWRKCEQSGSAPVTVRTEADTAVAQGRPTCNNQFRLRPEKRGKFFYLDGRPFHIRGLTYGPFQGTSGYPPRTTVANDMRAMLAAGANLVRVYGVPPTWFLDEAAEQGLWVLVGLPWEQHITFLDHRGRATDIEKTVVRGVRFCRDHPAVFAFVIGNEIPSSVVRWHGAARIERFLRRLYESVKQTSPGALVTYANYPSTEYLDLSFLDFASFNVYLEESDAFARYINRLQHLAGNNPLLITELGLDSRRAGEPAQARALEAQVRSALAGGCAGVCIFSWTDEWSRGGYEILDWQFGITTRDRTPKLALEVVRRTWAQAPFALEAHLPRVSVVVCPFNGAKWLGQCLRAAVEMNYPDFEIIVVDDGSTDNSAQIAAQFPVRLIRTANHGLGAARNIGWKAASGQIVAYLDDDAMPEVNWLQFLERAFAASGHAAVGGPNLPVPEDGLVAACVANAPGGPTHILLTEEIAEHIPGCNMAIRRQSLEAIGGFDERFHIAGDDVDICWRLQERGWTVGFSAAAMVWHHRRASAAAYWKQQVNYGRAEAQLERKWPDKYNLMGHIAWAGRLYERALAGLTLGRSRIYYGPCGSADFQQLQHSTPQVWGSLPLLPEWYLLVAVLAILTVLGALLWPALLLVAPALAVAGGLTLFRTMVAVRRLPSPGVREPALRRGLRTGLTFWLHLIQPAARLRGRLFGGLTPWRGRLVPPWAWPLPMMAAIWSESRQPPGKYLEQLEEALWARGLLVRRGGAYDRWDLLVQTGVLGGARVVSAVEEHEAGRQLFRVRARPWCPAKLALITAALAAMAAAAAIGHLPRGAIVVLLGCAGGAAIVWCIHTATALAQLRKALASAWGANQPDPPHAAALPRWRAAQSTLATPEMPTAEEALELEPRV
jgi:O-antigen biosynthesis protein